MRKYRSPVFAVLFIITALMFALLCVYNIIFSPHSAIETASGLSVAWCSDKGAEIDIENHSQLSAIAEDNKYSLFYTVENDNDNAYISFKNSFADTKVYVNGSAVYSTEENSYLMENSLFSFESAAPQFHFANLGGIKSGDTIRIDVNLTYDNDNYGISNVLVGGSEEIINTVFRNDLFGVALCIAIFCVGIILVMFYAAFRKVVSLHGVHYAGVFSMVASIYAFASSVSVSALEIMSADALYIIKTVAYTVMILPFIMFFMENTKFRSSDKILQAASVLQFLVIAVICVLGISGVYDLHKTIIIARLSMLVQFVLILAVLIFDFAKKNEKRSSDINIIVIYLIFLAGITAQLTVGRGDSIPIIFALTCLFFIIAVLIISMHSFTKALELSNEAEAMGKIAFTDGLTGVGNTAAFRKKLNHLEVVKINYKSIGIVQFDINNLKTINDTLGHEMGDKLIMDGSAMINRHFGNVGDVYRTGGDEFVAVVCCDNAFKLCNEAILKFEMAMNEYNADDSHRFLLQIAYGVEFYNSDSAGQYLSLREVQKLADKKMYENKRELKEIAKREGLEVIRSNSKKDPAANEPPVIV